VTLNADRRDLAHVTVEVQDGDGHRVPTAHHAVTLQVLGEGRLLGMDNGDPESHEDYKSAQHSAFNGLCLAIIGTTDRVGDIQILASSPDLAQATLTTDYPALKVCNGSLTGCVPLSEPRKEHGYEPTFTVRRARFPKSVQMGITLT